MKKLLVLFIAISFFASFALVACGPSGEQKPPAAKEEAKTAPAAPAPEAAKPGEPAKPGEAPAPAPGLRPRLRLHQQNSLLLFPGGYVRMDIPLNQGGL